LKFVVAVLSTAGLASIALVLVILGRLTAKFEAVTRKQSYYYLFYVLAGLMVLLGIVYLYRIAALVPKQLSLVNKARELIRDKTGIAASPHKLRLWFHLLFYYMPLAVIMTVSLILAWRNWGWILGPRGSRLLRSRDLRRKDLRRRDEDLRRDRR
jgi:hypothetical protein